MKYPLLPAALLGAALLFNACQPKSPQNTTGSKTLVFESASLLRQGGPDCQTEGGRCARIEWVYPLASGPDSALAQHINDSVQWTMARVMAMLNPDGDTTLIAERLADQFVRSYEAFLKDVPDYEMGWWIEGAYELHRNTEKLVSLELMISAFTGGAHPIGFSETFNFSVPEGKAIGLDDLILDKAGLTQLAEREFKLSRGLPEDANLSEEGFFYGDPFSLPANFVLTREGLYLIYNVYEAAPYALGPTEFVIPYDKLKGLVRIE